MTATAGPGTPAGPQLIRALNEELLLGHIRSAGNISRAELARVTGLSKPTVSLALTNLEAGGLVRPSGVRTGTPGPNAVLYEIRPEAGYVLALDVGREYLRGAIGDVAGNVCAREAPACGSDATGIRDCRECQSSSSSAIGRPMASRARRRRLIAAVGFQSRTIPASSTRMTPSSTYSSASAEWARSCA